MNLRRISNIYVVSLKYIFKNTIQLLKSMNSEMDFASIEVDSQKSTLKSNGHNIHAA